ARAQVGDGYRHVINAFFKIGVRAEDVVVRGGRVAGGAAVRHDDPSLGGGTIAPVDRCLEVAGFAARNRVAESGDDRVDDPLTFNSGELRGRNRDGLVQRVDDVDLFEVAVVDRNPVDGDRRERNAIERKVAGIDIQNIERSASVDGDRATQS